MPDPKPAPTPYLPDEPTFLPVPFSNGVYLSPPDLEPAHAEKPRTHRPNARPKLSLRDRWVAEVRRK